MGFAGVKNWAVIASRDLIHINNVFKRNVPTTMKKLSPQYANWYQHGYYPALTLARQVKNYQGYIAVLTRYVYGLDLPAVHLQTMLNTMVSQIQWPGFMVGVQKDKVTVIISPCHSYDPKHCPAVGAVLRSCDGTNVLAWIKKDIVPYVTMNQRYIDFQNLFVPNLLLNKGNPFREYPKQCTINNKVYSLAWHHFRRGASTYLKYIAHARDLPIPSLTITHDVYPGQFPYDIAIHHFAKKAVWIKIPSFSENYRHHLTIIKDNLASYRHEKVIVLDLRGNDGGSLSLARDMIVALYGKQFLQSLGGSLPLNQVWHSTWRLSKSNDALYRRVVSDKEHHFDAYFQMIAKDILGKYKDAVQQRKKQIEITNQYQKPTKEKIKDPVKARVYIVTDEACRGTCWLFVRELQAIPGTIQVGKPTGIFNQDFMDNSDRLKTGLITLCYPMASLQAPSEHLAAPFIPAFRYHGYIGNTTALKKWILKLTKLFKNNAGLIFR